MATIEIARGVSPEVGIREDITEEEGAAATTAVATFPALTHAGEETIRMGTPWNAAKNGAAVAAVETRTEMVRFYVFLNWQFNK